MMATSGAFLPRRTGLGQRYIVCPAITRQKQLHWGESPVEATVTSGRRLRRSDREAETAVVQKQTDSKAASSLRYEDVCTGVAWYKILVYGKQEETVARDLEASIRALPKKAAGQLTRNGRVVTVWVPEKRVSAISERSRKKTTRRIKYGTTNGEQVFLQCEMDAEVHKVVIAHPYVQRFVHRHPVQTHVALPCPAEELHDVFDWLWKDETITPEMEYRDILPTETLDDAPIEGDIVFDVDRLVNKRNEEYGMMTLVDMDATISDEYGPEWREKQKRLERKQQKHRGRRPVAAKQDRTENRVKRGRWRTRNPAVEQQNQMEMEDYGTTTWYEGQDDDETSGARTDSEELLSILSDESSTAKFDDTEESESDEAEEAAWNVDTAEEPSTAVGKEVLVLSGPYAEYNGIVLEASDGGVLVQVDVFGKATTSEFALEEVQILD